LFTYILDKQTLAKIIEFLDEKYADPCGIDLVKSIHSWKPNQSIRSS
jgi:hypothetical protein